MKVRIWPEDGGFRIDIVTESSDRATMEKLGPDGVFASPLAAKQAFRFAASIMRDAKFETLKARPADADEHA